VTRTRSLVGLALASTVLLTGCGASGWNPGVAAQVGDDTVSLSEVRDVTTSYCDAVETQLAEGQYVANGVVAAQVAGSLALRAAAELFAEAEGVEPDASLEDAEASLEQSIGELSEEQQDAVRTVNLARPYAAAVELAVGKEELGGSNAEAAAEAGHERFASWLEDQDVRIDPRFLVTIEGGNVSRTNSDISLPVSDTAKTAVSGEPDETYAAGLPSSQRCG
jgi:hypothetical protein